MLYVSDQIGKPVLDAEGQRMGKVLDILAAMRGGLPHPQVVALAVQRRGEPPLLVTSSDVAIFVGPAVVLARAQSHIAPYAPTGECLWLARDILDKEVIDTGGARLVRVNDLELARVNGQFYVANVNVGGLAIARRLRLDGLIRRLARLVGKEATVRAISWDDVELLPGSKPVRMRLTHDKAADLHAADLADIISDLGRTESTQVVASLDTERLAETLEEVSPEVQASLVEALPDEKVAEVLEEMAPDEAADLLAELPEERSQNLIKLMDREEAADVQKLLAYPEDTAGGLMNTDVVTLRPNLTAEQAIATLRHIARDAETVYYVYVTDEENHLLGVFSLQSLILADPNTPITQIMHDRVITVKPDDSQSHTGQIVARYNLLAVPVVDDENHLLGIVTADDALDKIIPTTWKRRLPWRRR